MEDKRRLAKKIASHLSSSPEVRPFPQAVARLASACQDPDADSQTFEAIIACDPALSLRILRLANSPLFCAAGVVKNIGHAVTLLGLRKLKSVAMSVAAATMFCEGGSAAGQRQALLRHSVGCGVVARHLARQAPDVDDDDAFLAGIFHDIGKLLFYDVIPDEYAELEVAYSGAQLVEEERFFFGTTHEEIGLCSASSWNLPEPLRASIGWHHRPKESVYCPDFAKIIGNADALAKFWSIGSGTGENGTDLADALQWGGEYGLATEDELAELEKETRHSFEETIAATTE